MHEAKEESDEEEGQRYVLHVHFKTTLDIQLGFSIFGCIIQGWTFQLRFLNNVTLWDNESKRTFHTS